MVSVRVRDDRVCMWKRLIRGILYASESVETQKLASAEPNPEIGSGGPDRGQAVR